MRHVDWLRSITNLVKGITLNTNLYTEKERSDDNDEQELLPKQESDFGESNELESEDSAPIRRR